MSGFSVILGRRRLARQLHTRLLDVVVADISAAERGYEVPASQPCHLGYHLEQQGI